MVRISVVMPNYNNEKYLKEAMTSILNQTYSDFEFIIIDDCSTDNSWNIIEEYAKKDPRVRAYRNEKNLKIVKTRNKLFSLCSSESKYIAIMDSDDISISSRLEKQVDFLEKFSEYGVVGSNLIIIDENSKKVGFREYRRSFGIKNSSILIKSPLAQPSVMIRRSVLGNLKYSSDLEVAEDWDLWLRLLKNCNGGNIKTPLLKYRVSTTQSKSTSLKKSILASLKVRFMYMNFFHYFNFKILFRIISEMILLMMPAKFVLWLFQKMEIKR